MKTADPSRCCTNLIPPSCHTHLADAHIHTPILTPQTIEILSCPPPPAPPDPQDFTLENYRTELQDILAGILVFCVYLRVLPFSLSVSDIIPHFFCVQDFLQTNA